MSVARLLWQDAGCPGVTKASAPSETPCALCGLHGLACVRLRDALGSGFTDFDKLAHPTSDGICVACVWALGGKPPDTFRLWSVVYRADRLAAPSNPKAVYLHGPHTHCTSKADVSAIVDVMLDPPDAPWVCAVAESGQIHTLPFARINRGDTWVVRYEREDIASTSAEFARVLHHACALLAAGYVREDITTEPHPSKLVKHGIAVWREHAEPLKQWRRSGLLALAIALTRKETYGDLRDRACERAGLQRRPAIVASHITRAGDDGVGVDRPDQPNGLVAARQVRTTLSVREGDDVGRAGDGDGAQAPDRRPASGVVQGDLFARLGGR